MDLPDPSSILIVKPSSLGDIVHSLPAVDAIRKAYPTVKLRWIANTEWMPLLENSPILDEVLEFPRKKFRGLAAIGRIMKWAGDWRASGRSAAPEWVLDFQGLLRSALISKDRGSGPIIGLSDAREGASWFYTLTVPVNTGAHAVDRYLELPRALGIPVPLPSEVSFPLPIGTRPNGWPDDEQPPIVVHPWSRGQGKSLTDTQLQQLCDQLTPCRVVIVGRSEGQPAPSGDHIVDLSNQTSLPELIWVMREATWCISVDSGPMHIASAVNPRTLGIHTWSDPRKVGPYHPACFVWKSGRIAHRDEFSESECISREPIDEAAMEAIAQFVTTQVREKR